MEGGTAVLRVPANPQDEPGEVEESGDDSDSPEGSVQTALLLFLTLICSLKAAVGSVLIIASQLTHTEGKNQKWVFLLVTGAPYITGSAAGVAAIFDAKYDRLLGVQKAVFYRVVIASLLVSACAVGIALVPNGAAQVVLSLAMCFLVDAVVYSCVQFVAVVDPSYSSGIAQAMAIGFVVPVAAVSLLQLDTAAEWSLSDRMKLFTPPVVMLVACVVLFFLAWPTNVKSSHDGMRRMTKQLVQGLRAMEPRPSAEAVAQSSLAAPMYAMAPSPYYLATLCGCVNAATALLLLPMTGLVPSSAGQAALIVERFWGELAGQCIGTVCVGLGLGKARVPDLVLCVVLTLLRVGIVAYTLPLLRTASLGTGWIFSLRLIDTFVFSTTMVIAISATPQEDRRLVSRTDFGVRQVCAVAGLAACAAVIATAPETLAASLLAVATTTAQP